MLTTYASDTALDQVVGQLASAGKGQSTSRVLGIAGCRKGAGATFVTRTLSRSLSRRTDEEILETSITDLIANADQPVSSIVNAGPANLWTLKSPTTAGIPSVSPIAELQELVDVLSRRFRFILVDCGAVTTSGMLWPLAQVADDMVLVVAAGETRAAQVKYAQRLIARSGAHLAGCILNKRTYPLPARLYELFA